jgi:fluoride exporter
VIVLLAAGLVGGLGSIARFALDGAVSRRAGRAFPFGTLAVNLSGAFVLGLLAGVALSDAAYRVAGAGLIGAFTTFSTWALESHRLAEDGRAPLGALNFAASLVLGVALSWAGNRLGAAL